jgi:hypothetical protein
MPDGMASSLPAAGCAVCAVCLLLFAADRRPAGNAKDKMTIQ